MQVIIRIVFPKIRSEKLNSWNHLIMPVVRVRAPIAPVKGQGLWSTK
jgi:hypothetical protein